MSTFNKIYKKVANNGNSSDYQAVATVGINGVDLAVMKGASSSADGEIGLVPKPSKGNQNKYLRADGTWQTPPDTNTTYDVFTGSNNGLVPSTKLTNTFLTSKGTWEMPWIATRYENNKLCLSIGVADSTTTKVQLSEASTSTNGLMSAIDKSVLKNYLMLIPFYLFWYEDSVNVGAVSDTGYKSELITHYIYEKKVDNVGESQVNNQWYPVLLKLIQNNLTTIGYDPCDAGCTFGNVESIWNEGNGTISKDYQNNTNCIKIQYRVYVNVRTHCGTHSIYARSHTYICLTLDQRNFIANNVL